MASKANHKVKNLTVKRDGNKIKVTWSLSSSMKDDIDELVLHWEAIGNKVNDGNPGSTLLMKAKDVTLKKNKTSYTISINRDNWYPNSKKPGLSSIDVTVYGRYKEKNKKGKTVWKECKAAGDAFKFSRPERPTASLDIGSGSNQLLFSAAVKAENTDSGKKERYDTRYQVLVKKSGGSESKAADGTFTATSKTITRDVAALDGAETLGYNDWVRVRFKAWNRGFHGASKRYSSGNYEMLKHVYAQPPIARIDWVEVSGQQVNVSFTVGASAYHPCDSVQLLRWKGSALNEDMSEWDEVENGEGSGSVVSLHDSLSEAKPAVGQRVWYGIRTEHDTYVNYSAPKECESLFMAKSTSTGASISVASAGSNGDGESATVTLKWTANSSWDGTVLAWSDDQMAWQSNDEPDDFEFEDAKWPLGTVTEGGKTYVTATVKVKGLDDGTRYFFRAKRTSSANDTDEGEWSDALDVRITSIPSAPVLTTPGVVERGKDVSLSWSATEQTSYEVRLYKEGSYDYAVAKGDGSASTASIPYADITKLLGRNSIPSSVLFRVGASSGGDLVWSQPAAVAFADKPTATLVCTDTAKIESRAWAFYVQADQADATATVELVSNGISVGKPDGNVSQADGEVVWSAQVDCVEKGATVTAEQTSAIPDSVLLGDGGDYTLRVTPYASGLQGEAVEQTLTVAWKHQAEAPKTCPVEVDSDALTATLTPAKPSNAADTDVADVYRLTPDRAYLVAEGVAFGSKVTDAWAPFSDEANWDSESRTFTDDAPVYRVCTRTADGDLDWQDFPYTLKESCIRLDWDGGSLELPHSVNSSESWEKGFEARTYLDGEDAVGYWNPSTTRTVTLSATAIRSMERDALDALRRLARYAGPVFVRTPNGCAYEADVQVSGLDEQHSSMLATVQLACTEVVLKSFLATVDASVDDDTEGEA